MLHLFKRVYVTTDAGLDITNNRIVISAEHGFPMYHPLEEFKDGGKLLGYGPNLDGVYESMPRVSNFPQLIEFLYNYDDRVIVYVDDQQFMEFMALWYKALFKNPTSSSTWDILNAYIRKHDLQRNWMLNEFSAGVAYTNVNAANYDVVFQRAEKHDLSVLVQSAYQDLSFDILIANYINNPTKFTAPMATCMQTVLLRAVDEMLIEVKQTFYKGHTKSTFPRFSVGLEFFSQSSLYVEEAVGQVGSKSSVDILGATQQDVDTAVHIATTLYREWDQFKDDAPIVSRLDLVNIVRNPLTPPVIDAVLEMERSTGSNNRIYAPTDEEKLNTFFIDLVLAAPTAEMTKYEIV